MSDYPELREFVEGFADRYTRTTELGSALTAPEEELHMKGYPQNLELVEFIEIFRERYVVEGGNGLRLVVMTNDELLLLSKYLYSGIMDWKVAAMNGTRGPSDLRKSLERFARRNAVETGLDVIATEEELRALGVFLVRGLAEVFLVLERIDERAYCC